MDNKPRIALAIENFSRFGGGAESYSVELSRTLVNKGWDVHLFGYSWDGDPAEASFHKLSSLPKWIPPSIRILHFAVQHKKLVSSEHFDIVLGFGNTILMNVYQSHGGVHEYSTARKLMAVRNPLLRFIKRMAVQITPKYYVRSWIESAPFRSPKSVEIIAISDMVKLDMAKYFGVQKDKVRLVYNGIDIGRFGNPVAHIRRELRANWGFKSDSPLFLFMAYDFRKKGVRFLIEAAGILKKKIGSGRKFGIVVAGGNPDSKLQKLVRRFELEEYTVFPGPTRDPEDFYQACDVFVLPTFYDACSLVVFEAMAAGVPVITTQYNGASGIITPGSDGFVLGDPADVEGLADAMESFLDPEFRAKASIRAHLVSQHYSVQENHRKMLNIFNRVAGIDPQNNS